MNISTDVKIADEKGKNKKDTNKFLNLFVSFLVYP